MSPRTRTLTSMLAKIKALKGAAAAVAAAEAPAAARDHQGPVARPDQEGAAPPAPRRRRGRRRQRPEPVRDPLFPPKGLSATTRHSCSTRRPPPPRRITPPLCSGPSEPPLARPATTAPATDRGRAIPCIPFMWLRKRHRIRGLPRRKKQIGPRRVELFPSGGPERPAKLEILLFIERPPLPVTV
jgi:hypothetical protein